MKKIFFLNKLLYDNYYRQILYRGLPLHIHTYYLLKIYSIFYNKLCNDLPLLSIPCTNDDILGIHHLLLFHKNLDHKNTYSQSIIYFNRLCKINIFLFRHKFHNIYNKSCNWIFINPKNNLDHNYINKTILLLSIFLLIFYAMRRNMKYIQIVHLIYNIYTFCDILSILYFLLTYNILIYSHIYIPSTHEKIHRGIVNSHQYCILCM